jgi:hypothetical protein
MENGYGLFNFPVLFLHSGKREDWYAAKKVPM